MPKINDKRSNQSKPWGFVNCVDKFMSGWGGAEGGRSLYSVAVRDYEEAGVVLRNAKDRSEMKFCKISKTHARPHGQDHLTIVDRKAAGPWFDPRRPFRD